MYLFSVVSILYIYLPILTKKLEIIYFLFKFKKINIHGKKTSMCLEKIINE